MKTKALLGTAILALGLCSEAYPDTNSTLNTEANRMNTLATRHGESNVVGKMSGDFGSFLGPDSSAVITGLRNGTPITLTTTSTTPGSTTPVVNNTVITPPTGKMGFGNAYISLALAKQQLTQLGVTQPTPQQLQAALTGGTITTGSGPTATTTNLQGVLTMRSQKMGWGQIAQKSGFKLGPVISGMKSANQSMTTTTTPSSTSKVTTASGQSNGKTESGIVSAGGKSQGSSANAMSGKKSSGQGIVSAAGRSGGGNAYGHGKGIVTGSGQAASGSGVTTGGGHGNSSGHGQRP
jgi:hypothetical protein